jgi:hypothetical protein
MHHPPEKPIVPRAHAVGEKDLVDDEGCRGMRGKGVLHSTGGKAVRRCDRRNGEGRKLVLIDISLLPSPFLLLLNEELSSSC